MSYSQTWLESEGYKCILIELGCLQGGVTETYVYISNYPYSTSDGITQFSASIVGDVTFSESISLSGASIAYSDIEINNANGALDSWLDPASYVWVNRSVKIYFGDPTWVSTNLANMKTLFSLVVDGIIEDIDSRSRNTLNIKIRNKAELLNGPVTENVLGTYGTWAGGQTNQDTIKPVVFGEVCNVEPLLVDPALLKYMVNDGAMESFIEIRDNGVPIYTNGGITTGADVDLVNGTFELNQKAVGTITVSLQGTTKSTNLTTGAAQTSYVNNIANIISTIVTQYGKGTPLVAADLDLTSLAAFAATNTQPVGICIKDRENIIDICSQVASSIGASVVFDRTGKLRILRIGTAVGTNITITDTDILLNTLEIVNKTTVVSASKIGYCRNWALQSGLETSIPDAHKELFMDEYLIATYDDAATKTKYKLTSEPEQSNTLLLTTATAITEVTRRTDLFKIPRTIYRFTGTRKLMSLALGQPVTIIHNRFNLYNGGSGTVGQVVGLTPNWSKMTIDIEVFV